MKKILLIGGGGHCKSIIETLHNLNIDMVIGVVDNSLAIGSYIQNCKVVGTDNDLEQLHSLGYEYAFISLGSIGTTNIRRKIYDNIKILGFKIPSIIDKESYVSKTALIGEGVYIARKAIVNIATEIGTGAIINTGAIIEHECTVGEFTHISPGSILCGNVLVSNDCHIGAGAIIKQGVTIDHNTIIGAGAVIIHDVEQESKYVGNPGRRIG